MCVLHFYSLPETKALNIYLLDGFLCKFKSLLLMAQLDHDDFVLAVFSFAFVVDVPGTVEL